MPPKKDIQSLTLAVISKKSRFNRPIIYYHKFIVKGELVYNRETDAGN